MKVDDAWWFSAFAAAHRAQNVDELLELAAQETIRMGFEWCSFGVRVPTSATTPLLRIIDNYPFAWMERYSQCNYIDIDPTVSIGTRTHGAVIWSDSLFRGARALWNDAQDIGLSVGVGMPSWSQMGSFALYSVARSCEQIMPNELATLVPRLKWLSSVMHERMNMLLLPSLLKAEADHLSRREREVLVWTADGKTSWEIATILDISVSTVNFHVNNAIVKMSATNKTHAAFKAGMLGLLNP